MGFAKGSLERRMFASYYSMCEKWWDCPMDDDKWEELIDEVDAFNGAYITETDRYALQLTTLLLTRKENQRRHILPLCKEWDGAADMIGALLGRRAAKDGE